MTNNQASKDIKQTLENPLLEAVEQVGNLLSIGGKSSPKKGSQITKELHQYEKSIIKKRGSTPHR